MNDISGYASIHHNAVIGKNNKIGPYSVIHENVTIGDNNIISSNVVIGSPPGVRDNKEQIQGNVKIGNNNVFKEFSLVQSPIRTDLTSIGNNNYITVKCSVGHDCILHNNINMVASVSLGGKVEIQDDVFLGIGVIIHPRKLIGKGSMLGMGTIITKNILPYSTIIGVPARIYGFNKHGCIKRDIDEDYMKEIEEVFELYRKSGNFGKYFTATNPLLKEIKEFINDDTLTQFKND